MRRTTLPEGVVPATTMLAWDEEANAAAVAQLQDISLRDPEASQFLAQQVVAHPYAPEGTYDVMRLYAECADAWNWTPNDIDAIHFQTLFGLIRERVLAQERAKRDAPMPDPVHQPRVPYEM